MFISPLLWLNEFTHFFCYRIGQKLSVWNRSMTTVYWAIMLCFIVIVIKNENVKDLGPAWSDSHHTRLHIYLCLSYFLSYAHARTHKHFIFNQKPIMSLGSDANKTQTHTQKKINKNYDSDDMDSTIKWVIGWEKQRGICVYVRSVHWMCVHRKHNSYTQIQTK